MRREIAGQRQRETAPLEASLTCVVFYSLGGIDRELPAAAVRDSRHTRSMAWLDRPISLGFSSNSFLISVLAKDKNGFLFHEVESDLQGGPTEIQVLLPDRLEKGRRYQVLYVLPVEANRENRWGEGLLEVKKLDLHNRLGLIVVQIHSLMEKLPQPLGCGCSAG